MAIINYIEKHSKTFSVQNHKHLYFEIIYVTEGSGEIITEKDTFNYKKGETIIIPPNLYHKNLSSEGMKNIHLTIEDIVLSITKPTIIPESQSSSYLYKILKICYDFFHFYPIDCKLNLSLSNTVCSLIEQLLNTPIFAPSTLLIEKEIIENYTIPEYNIDNAFLKCQISKERARKKFTQEKGITPVQFLKTKRIELAKHLLLNKAENDLTINEIAYSCGFIDPAYFSRVFKQETGVSPLQYQLSSLENNKIFD